MGVVAAAAGRVYAANRGCCLAQRETGRPVGLFHGEHDEPYLKKPIQPKTLINPLRGSEKEQIKEEQEYFKEQFGLK